MPTTVDWSARFAAALTTAEQQSQADFRVACGFTNDVDVVVKLDDATRTTLEAIAPDRAGPEHGRRPPRIDAPCDVVDCLLHHMRHGTGDVLDVGSVEMDSWLADHFPASLADPAGRIRLQLGGTGAQAANTLAYLGYAALVHVTALSAADASVFSTSPKLVVATPDGLRPLFESVRPGDRPAYHYVLEYQTGDRLEVGGVAVVASRANRIIMFYDPVNDSLPIDPLFIDAIADPASRVRCVLISGFSNVESVELSHARIAAMVGHMRDLRRARPGLLFHVELAAVSRPALVQPLVAELSPHADSVGLNEQELAMVMGLDRALPLSAIEDQLRLLAAFRARLGVPRVGLHTQDYCLALTDFDPHAEQATLLFASLVAGTRARLGRWPRMDDLHRTLADGRPDVASLAAEQRLAALTPLDMGLGRYGPPGRDTNLVFAPTLSVTHPAGTVGLGDSFAAGVLVMLER